MKKMLVSLLTLLVIIGIVIIAMRLIFPAPKPAQTASAVMSPAAEGFLAEGISELVAEHPGKTGILSLANGMDAFTARMAIIQAAKTSIDIRYYIWHRDMTGLVMMKALHDAAERGVRVRLLVDDNGTPDFDAEFAALEKHPNFEIRIFNPFVMRTFRQLGYVFDFFRLNRRMHNKSITVDGVATILGGRNVGDEYFSAGEGSLFVDLDVLAIGEVLPDVVQDFQDYWASPSAIPSTSVIDPELALSQSLEQDAADVRASREFAAYRSALGETDLARRIAEGRADFVWAQAKLYSDDPAKGQGPVKNDSLMLDRLASDGASPKARFSLVSPYFIPGKRGTSILAAWAKAGIDVRVLTNALEATDVIPVHAGYTKYREDLLESGVKLYELKQQAAPQDDRDAMGLIGSSAASLHAKTFSIDGDRIFVGSFNFDPRSYLLNCEMGLVIDDPGLAGQLDDLFGVPLETASFRVTQDNAGNLAWETKIDGKETVLNSEPGGSVFKGIALTVLGWLPIEWLL